MCRVPPATLWECYCKAAWKQPERENKVHVPAGNSACCCRCTRAQTLGRRPLCLGRPAGSSVGAGRGANTYRPSLSIGAQPKSQAPPDPKRPRKGFPHLPRKRSCSEVVREEAGKEILVEGEVIGFKFQGFSSWSCTSDGAQRFAAFLEKNAGMLE